MRDSADADRGGPALADLLTDAPRLARPGPAAERLDGLLARLPDGHAVASQGVRPEVEALLRGLADHSPFLWRLAAQCPDRLARLLATPPLDLAPPLPRPDGRGLGRGGLTARRDAGAARSPGRGRGFW